MLLEENQLHWILDVVFNEDSCKKGNQKLRKKL